MKNETNVSSEWVCLYCPSHIVVHVELSHPPIHWCSGRGHRQHEMQPIQIGGTPDDAA